MAKLRVSVVEFLNTAPLVWGFTHGPLQGRYDLSFTVPSLCAEALRAGKADIAIIPSVEYQRIPGLAMLPDIAVAAKGEVRSILVIAKKPIENAKRIALDTDSRSSVALTRLLCRGLWGIAPEFVDAAPDPAAMLAQADAALIIGDPALRLRLEVDAAARKAAQAATSPAKERSGFWGCCGTSNDQPIAGVNMLFVYDVAEEWRRMTGKPCVLAVWAGRRDALTPEVAADFLASKAYGLAHIDEIASHAALQLHLPPRQLEQYLRDNIDFSLDADNRAGLEQYYALCAAEGLIPSARPIEFVTMDGPAAGNRP